MRTNLFPLFLYILYSYATTEQTKFKSDTNVQKIELQEVAFSFAFFLPFYLDA
ncbi:MAG: hypothetical protein PHR59_03815 [Candidatus Cloacimonetes bacterium]|nr:hypothetical protein [Candidatus Cloacimonadota bacterium]MDD4667079.1 hypothetical protein [Candidatus Cloacimonadota bacterium]